MNIKDILLKRAEAGTLAHFYIVEGRDALSFVHDFVRCYYQQIEGHKQSITHLQDHPDVLVLGNVSETEKKVFADYTVLEAETVNRFFEYKSVQSKRKIAVITEGERIGNIVANKWLKLLEEPTGTSTIFILNAFEQKLLPTIHSRAIHIRLPHAPENPDMTDWNEFVNTTKNLQLSEFLESYGREKRLDFWINELLRWESQQKQDLRPKAALQDWLKTLQEMDDFNQPAATKWTLFHSYLKEHVYHRLSR